MIPPVSDDDLYLLATINRHRASDDDSTTHRLRRLIASLLRRWTYSNHLESVTVSGSHAKATALRDSDLDLFLSLSPSTPGPLSSIHASLAGHFRGCLPLTRNVSVRIMFEGAGIDLVPGRRRPDSTVHTLWQSRMLPGFKPTSPRRPASSSIAAWLTKSSRSSCGGAVMLSASRHF